MTIRGEVRDGEYHAETINQCPWKTITPFTNFISDLYMSWKAGLFYESGGWVDQPAWYCEAMNLMNSVIKRTQLEDMKEQK